jgi:acyl carrier protein
MINKTEFLEKFRNLFDETEFNEIQLDTKFKELEEWSSLIILSLIVVCEEEFQSHIKPIEIENSKYVNDLIVYLEKNQINND